MTFHPYQIEKLHGAISPRSKTLTADSDALRMFDPCSLPDDRSCKSRCNVFAESLQRGLLTWNYSQQNARSTFVPGRDTCAQVSISEDI
jgi:hypothetical protein